MDLLEVNPNNLNRHPWELSRTDSLIKEIKNYHQGKYILDVGCGDSFLDKKLIKEIKINKLYGIDVCGKEMTFSPKHIVINNYQKLHHKKFSTILMFDVLEHIQDNEEFLKKTILPLLDHHGKIIMTVPAYQALYGKHDQVLKHFRRYTIKDIQKLSLNLNLKITNYHYFYFSLVPLRLISKLIHRDNKINSWKYSSHHFLTKALKTCLNLDYQICKKMKKFSCGLSLFVVLER